MHSRRRWDVRRIDGAEPSRGLSQWRRVDAAGDGVHDGYLRHQVWPGGVARGRARHGPVGGAPGAGRDRPLSVRRRGGGRGARGAPEGRGRRGAVRSGPGRAHGCVVPGGHRLRARRGVRRVCRGGWRVEHRHGQGGQPLCDVSRRAADVRQSADRPGEAGPRAAEAAGRGADDGGDRQRDDRGRHLRLHALAREDRDRAPRAPDVVGSHRPGEYEGTAPPGGRVRGARRAEPCGGVLHRAGLRQAAGPREPRPAAGVPGREPDQRRLVDAGGGDGRAASSGR